MKTNATIRKNNLNKIHRAAVATLKKEALAKAKQLQEVGLLPAIVDVLVLRDGGKKGFGWYTITAAAYSKEGSRIQGCDLGSAIVRTI